MPVTATDPHDCLDVGALTTAIERFSAIFIRLPRLEKLSFTTLSVLHTLAHAGPLRLADLTATEQVTQPAITQLVTRLEREGLVARRPDPDDGRAVRVHITGEGRRIVEARRADRVAQLAALIEQLTPEQRRALGAALPSLTRMAELVPRPEWYDT